ncbi:hypothetical protein IQ255_18790 [Pleurocapsales cyanobacterium LEGE 10410]|nr:hypothetical protein [Pleurocapsales cyanobacterium LEGE 10410]
MSEEQFWYVVKQEDGTCAVVNFATVQTKTPKQEQWGSFNSQSEAIAKRVGLIRAGKCKPQ